MAAAVLALAGLTSFRGIEILRSTILFGPKSVEHDPLEITQIRCQADMCTSRRSMYPFDVFCPAKGFRGDARRWLAFLTKYAAGCCDCLLPDIICAPGHASSIHHATE